MVAVVRIVLLATVLLSTFVTALHTRLAPMMPAMASPMWHLPQLAVTFEAATVLFALMFTTLPSVHIHKRDAWMAGAFTAVLFTLGELAIGAYLARAAPGGVYGAARLAARGDGVGLLGAGVLLRRRAHGECPPGGRYVSPELAKAMSAVSPPAPNRFRRDG